MAFNRSFADIMAEWDALLRAREESSLAGSSRLDKLAALRERALALSVERWFYESQRRRAVAELNAVLREGLDEARDFRAELRGVLGSRSEELVTYEIKPLREGARRRRRKAGQPTESSDASSST